MGGVFGLWLGMSILTLFEFFEFLLDLLVLTCATKTSRNRVKSLGSGEKEKQAENIGGAHDSDEKNGGNTETFANTLPPMSHAYSDKQWKKSSNPFSKRQDSRETLMSGSFEMANASPPPPYTSRVGSGASKSTDSSRVSQRRSRLQPKANRQPQTVEENEEVTESYLLSV